MLENPSTVQLDHRILATTTFTAILSLWAYTRFNSRLRAAIPNNVRKGMLGVVHLVLLQATLGITTLLYLVPIPLAAAHQAGALALLSGTLVLGNRIWVNPRVMRLLKARLETAAVAGASGKGLSAGASSRARLSPALKVSSS